MEPNGRVRFPFVFAVILHLAGPGLIGMAVAAPGVTQAIPPGPSVTTFPVCELESANSIDSQIAQVYSGSSERNLGNSSLPQAQVETEMNDAWNRLCLNSTFEYVVVRHGGANLSVGLAIDFRTPQGNGTFSESWQNNSTTMFQETWTVSLVNGTLGGPTLTHYRAAVAGLLAPSKGYVSPPIGLFIVIGAAMATSLVVVLIIIFRRRRKGSPLESMIS